MSMQIIEPSSARTFVIKKGQILRVEDVDGEQVADFICYSEHDHSERFCQAKTRVRNWKVRISTGSELISNRDNVFFTIVADTVGVHDLIFSECNSYIYEHMLNIGPRNGCFENLANAVEPHGISSDDVPAPLNIFMNTGTTDSNELFINKTPSQRGDHIELRAEMDCLVAISACADDHTDCNGGTCTRIGITIR